MNKRRDLLKAALRRRNYKLATFLTKVTQNNSQIFAEVARTHFRQGFTPLNALPLK